MEDITGAFVCQISDTDWLISRVKGVYGNRKHKPDSRDLLRTQDQLSVIRDLISVRPGDLIFFHVIGREFGISALYGPYTPRSIPFYDSSKIWNNNKEGFPFRFLFKPFPGYEPICDTDMSIRVSDLYQAIESRGIWSLATLENERNMEKRAVRKISLSDAHIILNIFLREYKSGQKSANPIKLMLVPSGLKHMRTQITDVGRYENAIKALFMDKLADKHASLTGLFHNYVDYMNETFVAPTTRKLIDILVVSKTNGDSYNYYIVEAKNAKFGLGELRQLMLYIDLFRQRPIFRPDKDKVSACALASTFDTYTIRFRDSHNTFSPHDPIVLIQYKPINQARDAIFSELPQNKITPTQGETITPLPWGTPSPMKDMVNNTSTKLPCYNSNKYVVRNLKKQPTPNSFIIEEKSKLTNSTISICYVFVWDKVFSESAFHSFLNIQYQEVAPLVSYNFRAINPVIISRGYNPITLNYVSSYNDLAVRRPISVFQW